MRTLAAALLFTTWLSAQPPASLLLRITGTARDPVDLPFPKDSASASAAFDVLPRGRLQVRAVRSGDAVTASLAYVPQEGAAAQPAGRYTLRRGETASPGELAALGLAPLDLRLTELQPVALSPSLALNRSQSVVVESLVQEGPQYLLTLRNQSREAVTGLEIDQPQARGRRAMQENGRPSQPVLAPGGAHQVRLAAAGAGSADLPLLVIAAVTFADGSWEGDPPACAELLARSLGDTTERKRLAGLMAAALDSSGAGGLERLRAHAAALPEPDPGPLDSLLPQFPGLNAPELARLRTAYRVSARNARQAFLREIDGVLARPTRVPPELWLRRWIEVYSN